MAKSCNVLRRLAITLTSLVFFFGSVHISKPDHLVNRCNKQYYNWPLCVDNPDGYGCKCGPGFSWNTMADLCISSAVDSSLDFERTEPIRYTLLLGRLMPELEKFTICLWLRVSEPNHRGTVFSYAAKLNRKVESGNAIRLTAGPTLTLEVAGQKIDTEKKLNRSEWYHIALKWRANDGVFTIFLDGKRLKRGKTSYRQPIAGKGEFTIGQSARYHAVYDPELAFKGLIAHVHIWGHEMTAPEVRDIYRDCTFSYCGDLVEWVDFRIGTRGEMKLRWPSGIFNATSRCIQEQKLRVAETCDKYCSHTIGAQCKEQIVENILWPRAPANTSVAIACPGQSDKDNDTVSNGIKYAHRSCVLLEEENEGLWEPPDIDNCVQNNSLALRTKLEHLVKLDTFQEEDILIMAESLRNDTTTSQYRNPIDIATQIDSLHHLINAQSVTLQDISWTDGMLRFAQTQQIYPSFQQTRGFVDIVLDVGDAMLSEANNRAWEESNPLGAEGDEFMKIMDSLMETMAKSLINHVKRGDTTASDAFVSKMKNHIALKVKVYNTESLTGVAFPDQYDINTLGIDDKLGIVALPGEALKDINYTLPEYITVAMMRFSSSARMLPNHNFQRKYKDRNDNVNSAWFSLQVFIDDHPIDSFSKPLKLHLPYTDNFNISNPECRRLVHGNATKIWKWDKRGCSVVHNTTTAAECACLHPGTFVITTDMYDINWNKGPPPLILMEVPSYIGCSVSTILCIVTFIMLIYYKTASNTASIHKNFSLSSVFCNLVYMFGINQLGNATVCHVFAIMFHYFFLSTFSWLMNEAFNLYIVITYAAHSHGEHQQEGTQWRYYIIGWILPGAMVGAFVGMHTDDYYAPDMCWIAWQYVWLFLGPVLGIIVISILVLIFTAKEHNESSYSKNEKTNKMILNHSKALWTQVILLPVTWMFAFLSLRMRGVVLKFLYGMFAVLQGSFFLVFYFFLNEEVREVYKKSLKKKALKDHGYDYHRSDESSESDAGAMQLEEHHQRYSDEEHVTAQRKKKRRPSKVRSPLKGRHHTRIQIESAYCKMGVISLKEIEEGLTFGPFPVSLTYHDPSYLIGHMTFDKRPDIPAMEVDICDEKVSKNLEWMPYVSSARDDNEKNMDAINKDGHIYYKTIRHVEKNDELLVWYSTDFANSLRIPDITPFKMEDENMYGCPHCNQTFQYPNTLRSHMRFKCDKRHRLYDDNPPTTLSRGLDYKHLARNFENAHETFFSTYYDIMSKNLKDYPLHKMLAPAISPSSSSASSTSPDDYTLNPELVSGNKRKLPSSVDEQISPKRRSLEQETRETKPKQKSTLSPSTSPKYKSTNFKLNSLNRNDEENISAFRKVEKRSDSPRSDNKHRNSITGTMANGIPPSQPNHLFSPTPLSMPNISRHGLPDIRMTSALHPSFPESLGSGLPRFSMLPPLSTNPSYQETQLQKSFSDIYKSNMKMNEFSKMSLEKLTRVNNNNVMPKLPGLPDVRFDITSLGPSSPPRHMGSNNPMVEKLLNGIPVGPTPLVPASLQGTVGLLQNWCAKCNATFRMTSDLVYHMRSHHKGEGDIVKKKRDDKLRCTTCGETFRERHHLTRHLTSHQ
ncbi:unnamed protein product [Owenia fusiformis]|uniref:Uncharacterized protein n=1 Tax=Owenia fusiformis TaxID=6347 RepID=A0A8J1U6R8_OWEFU|nr:unnamed protein product [Owenia fusiformis]